MKDICIYTDGACSGNPGPGGWAAVLRYKSHIKEISGGEAETTNNRMELMAALCALELLREPCRVELHTDSAYLCSAFNDNWLRGWQRNGWMTVKKQPVENRDLWEKLLEQSKLHEITWKKVKGHSDDECNNRCDALARAAAKRFKPGGQGE